MIKTLQNYWIALVLGALFATFALYSHEARGDAGPVDEVADVAVDVSDAGSAPAAADEADADESDEADADVEADPVGFAKKTYDAAKSGNWWMLASMLVIALVWAARKWATKLSVFQGDRGGAILAISIGILGGMAHGIIADGAPTFDMLMESVKVTLGAIGGYAGLRKLLFPSDAKDAEASA